MPSVPIPIVPTPVNNIAKPSFDFCKLQFTKIQPVDTCAPKYNENSDFIMEDTRNDQQLNPPKLKLAKKQSIIRSDPDLEMEVDIAKPKWQYFHKKSIQRSEEPTKDQLKEGTGLWQQKKPHL